MKSYLLVLLILALNLVVIGQKQKTPKSNPSLTVEVERGGSIKLKAVDLEKLPRRELKAKDNEREAIYSGIELRDLLRFAGVKLGNELQGELMAAYVIIEAKDGYRVVFGIAELDAGFTDKRVLLADTINSQPFLEKEGPWKLIVPDDKRSGRWVRQVELIRVKFAKPKLRATGLGILDLM